MDGPSHYRKAQELAAQAEEYLGARRRSYAACGSAACRSRRELMPSLVKIFRRCHSTVRPDRNSRAPISGLVRPSQASWAMRASWAVSVAASRVPAAGHLVVDPAVAGVALPLSGKTVAPGLGMLPRGSVSPADGEWLRFFVYWRQKARRADYDLSALMLDEAYADAEHM
jgi:hypothetical protein